MITLDKKTLKQIKVKNKLIVHGFKDRDEIKKAFKSLATLKSMVRNRELYSESITETAIQEIKDIRSKLKNIKVVKHYSIPNRGVETFYTQKEDGYPVEQKPLDQKKWILRRLKEKIVSKRSELREPTLYQKKCKGHTYFMVGAVHQEPDTFASIKKNYKINRLKESKRPCVEENYIGLELEFFSPQSQDRLEKLLVDYDLWNNAEIKYDGSIDWEDESDLEYDYDDYTGFEVTLLCKEKEVYDIVERMSKVLFKMEAEVNESCGFHVHFDMRNRNYKRVYKNLCHLQSLLFKLVDESRQENDYCKYVSESDWDHAHQDHYLAINGRDAFRQHETIEIRMHHATTDKKEITNWIKLLLKVVNHRQDEYEIDTLETANKFYKLDSDVIDFYSRRGVS